MRGFFFCLLPLLHHRPSSRDIRSSFSVVAQRILIVRFLYYIIIIIIIRHGNNSYSVNYTNRSFSFLPPSARGKAHRSACLPVPTSCERPSRSSRRPPLPRDRRKRPLSSDGCDISLDLVNLKIVPFDASPVVVSPDGHRKDFPPFRYDRYFVCSLLPPGHRCFRVGRWRALWKFTASVIRLLTHLEAFPIGFHF